MFSFNYEGFVTESWGPFDSGDPGTEVSKFISVIQVGFLDPSHLTPIPGP